MNSHTFLFHIKYMTNQRNFFPPLDTSISPICSAIVSIIPVSTSSSTCDPLLLSTYQAIVHCLFSMVLFVMYLTYVLITNPCNFRVFADRSYHNSADYMQPYKTFNHIRYINLAPFYIHTFTFVLSSPQT